MTVRIALAPLTLAIAVCLSSTLAQDRPPALEGQNKPSEAAQGTSTDFGLKGDILGETLEDFKNRNARDVEVIDDPDIPGVQAFSAHVHYPVCSGDSIKWRGVDSNFARYELDVDAPPDKAHYTVCVTAGAVSGRDSPAGRHPTIAGVEAAPIYYFFDGRLFEISAFVGMDDFTRIEQGFGEKYGVPHDSRTEHLQNNFGATFESRSDLWATGDSRIELHERSAINKDRSSIDIYSQQRFRHYHRIKTPVGDPGKDL